MDQGKEAPSSVRETIRYQTGYKDLIAIVTQLNKFKQIIIIINNRIYHSDDTGPGAVNSPALLDFLSGRVKLVTKPTQSSYTGDIVQKFRLYIRD